MNKNRADEPDRPVRHDFGAMGSGFRLVPLKTTLELRAGDATIQVYITRIPTKAADKVLSILREAFYATESVDLQHLRRFAKPQDLPDHLKGLFSSCFDEGQDHGSGSKPAELYLILGPISSISRPELIQRLSSGLVTESGEPPIWDIAVPLLAPTSAEQAKKWSKSHWPTIYKKNNPFGPHPSIVSRAEEEIGQDLDKWMALASQAAAYSKKNGIGEAIGAVIVQRSGGTARAVALASDARWKGGGGGAGNSMAHAVLRGIGMVAQKLKAADPELSSQTESPLDFLEQEMFLDKPLHPDEQAVFDAHQSSPDGYLCLNLELYLTHEPCVMCSMAILHSRFGRVVFAQRMPRTGGLCGETHGSTESGEPVGLGYGLFWRKELNWSFLAWEATWEMDERPKMIEDLGSMLHV